ncbi:NADP-dependent oxidoreductase [Streptomyces longispororuber]|uniref:NADP-dependent oxidoreductase n=1 Tax=Streptomyces longispororuber TaxID=68230 RepID=UPI0036FC255B
MGQNPHTMRAITASTLGGPEVLRPAEVQRPEPGLTEILVRVHAAGVNPADYKARSTGGFGPWGDPRILGFDVSGTVEAVGPGVSIVRAGDEVFGMPNFPAQAGGYAQFVTAPARRFVPKPSNLSHTEAAALPLAGLTAWQCLMETVRLQSGERVLIHGAAGGVGHLAVQIAKAHGAYVIGTASADKHALARSLGADELIDYRTTDFTQAVADIDAVFDTVGRDYGTRSLQVLREGGRVVTLAATQDPAEMADARARGFFFDFNAVEPDRVGLGAVAALAAEGRLRPVIDTVFPLDDAAKAHAHGESGAATGKIVLSVAQ